MAEVALDTKTALATLNHASAPLGQSSELFDLAWATGSQDALGEDGLEPFLKLDRIRVEKQLVALMPCGSERIPGLITAHNDNGLVTARAHHVLEVNARFNVVTLDELKLDALALGLLAR